jgi:hypothetical protein
MVALTEAIMSIILRPLLFIGQNEILWLFLFLMPTFVTLIMFMSDFVGSEHEKRWTAEAKKHEDIKRTAVKVVELNGQQVVFHKDFVHIYKEDTRLLYMKIGSVKWLAQQIQELGL